jgi:hypothetical protein
MWSPRGELRARILVAIVVAAMLGCGGDTPAAGPISSGASRSANDAGPRDAGLRPGNSADGRAVDAAAAATDGGRVAPGFDFDDFAIDEDASTRADGRAVTPAWSCERGLRADGHCDCGCGDSDPDCGGSSCHAPSCFASGCDVCHGEAGQIVRCKAHWMCTLEREGGADGCNCGCGTADADCAPQAGCSDPGCKAKGCITCRSDDGSPMSCAP